MPAAKRPRRSSDLDLLRPFWSEPTQRRVLPNGLTVLLKPDHSSALCSVQVWVKTGSIHEGTLLGGGLSHYLEHMLFKGTERRAGREISATVQAHGGYINAYTTFDRTVYYIDIPSEHAGVAVDLLADAVLHSTLPADEVEREKQVILREIDMTLDEPDQRLGQTLFETAFRHHPYQYPIIGHRAVFEGVSREDLVAYYRARYVPNNLVLVVAGHFEPEVLMAEVEKHFGAAPRARLAPVYLPTEAVPLAPREAHLFEDVQISRAGLGWQIPGLEHADTPVLDLLGTVLGYGNSSILWEELREKRRLVHSIEASAWNPGTVGLFYVSMLCDPDKREQAAAAVQAELAKIARRGLAPALLKKAVRQLVVGEINTRKTMSGQASRLGLAEVVVGDLHYSRHYFDRIATVTPADIKRVAATYFVPERFTAVSMNPKVAAGATAAATPASELADFAEERLPNGARLLLLPDKRLPNLHLRLVCLGGVTHDLPEARGALSLMVTLLTKDTKTRTADEVAELIEEVGGSFHEFAGNNTFGISLEVLPGDVDRALDVLGQAVLAPAFAKETLEIEREAHLASLAEQADDVVTVARKLVRRKFFGTHPLAIDSHGTEEGLKAVTPAVLRTLHKRLLVAGNCVLVATGDFEPRRLAPKLKALLAKLPKGVAPDGGPAVAGAPGGAGARRGAPGRRVRGDPAAPAGGGVPGVPVLGHPRRGPLCLRGGRRGLQRHGLEPFRACARTEGAGVFRALVARARGGHRVLRLLRRHRARQGPRGARRDRGRDPPRAGRRYRARGAAPLPDAPQGRAPHEPPDQRRPRHAGRAQRRLRPAGQRLEELRCAHRRRDDRAAPRLRPPAFHARAARAARGAAVTRRVGRPGGLRHR